MLERWYDCVIADAGKLTTRWVSTRGSHMGEAIARAEQKNGRVVAVGLGAAPIGESVGKAFVERGPGPALPADAASARWPRGVIPEWQKDVDLRVPQLGYVVRNGGETATASPAGSNNGPAVVVEVACAADSVHDLWLSLVEQMPYVDNVEVRLQPQFQDVAHTDIWLTPRINGKKAIRFLDDHQADLSNNGLVEIAAYLRSSNSTMRLTEHKTIVWVSHTESTLADMQRWLTIAKVPKLATLPEIAATPHWHYRVDKSSTRERMEKRLVAMRLKRVDRIVAAS